MSFQVCGIYKIENLINAKKYIGQSVDIERRFKEHKRPCQLVNPTKELYIAFKEFGMENFSFEIIEECSKEMLNEREWYWIDYYDSLNNGYNMSTIENLQHKLRPKQVHEIQKELISSTETNAALARKYGVSSTWISLVNKGDLWYNSEFTYPLRLTPRLHPEKDKPKQVNTKKGEIVNYCVDCGKIITLEAKRCVNCANIAQRVAERPDRDTLKNLIRTQSFTTIGAMYGVSDNTIRKWCRAVDLPPRKTDIKEYSDEEWKNI